MSQEKEEMRGAERWDVCSQETAQGMGNVEEGSLKRMEGSRGLSKNHFHTNIEKEVLFSIVYLPTTGSHCEVVGHHLPAFLILQVSIIFHILSSKPSFPLQTAGLLQANAQRKGTKTLALADAWRQMVGGHR